MKIGRNLKTKSSQTTNTNKRDWRENQSKTYNKIYFIFNYKIDFYEQHNKQNLKSKIKNEIFQTKTK